MSASGRPVHAPKPHGPAYRAGDHTGPHPSNLFHQPVVTLHPHRPKLRIPLRCLVRVVGRRSDRQHRADRLDSVLPSLVIDKGNHHFGRRSSSACAKYADAFRRISFARRSSRTSRSSSFTRARSSLDGPDLRPRSRSSRLTQFRRVSLEQPIFSAIDTIAVYCESYSRSCSNTIRTARSRTSGEYFFALVMTQPLKSWSLRQSRDGSLEDELHRRLCRISDGSTSYEEARQALSMLVAELESREPDLAEWLETDGEDTLSCFHFPEAHRKLRTTNGTERVNQELLRRSRCRAHLPEPEELPPPRQRTAEGVARRLDHRPALPPHGRAATERLPRTRTHGRLIATETWPALAALRPDSPRRGKNLQDLDRRGCCPALQQQL
jgi:hypothetical protein